MQSLSEVHPTTNMSITAAHSDITHSRVVSVGARVKIRKIHTPRMRPLEGSWGRIMNAKPRRRRRYAVLVDGHQMPMWISRADFTLHDFADEPMLDQGEEPARRRRQRRTTREGNFAQ